MFIFDDAVYTFIPEIPQKNTGPFNPRKGGGSVFAYGLKILKFILTQN
jgi:hypothetical protein